MDGMGWLVSTRVATDVAVLVLFKGTLVLVVGMALSRLLRHRSAALRHRVWVLTLTGLLCLPLVAGSAPSWGGAVVEYPRESPLLGVDALEVSAAGAPADALEATAVTAPPSPVRELPAWSVVLLLWWVGVVAALSHFAMELLRVAFLRRRCREAPPGHRARALMDAERVRLGIRRSVSLLLSDEPGLAATVGALRPAIMLGPDVLELDEGQLRSVLLHELVHIRRGDYLANLVGALAMLLYWPNPLFWMARRRASFTLEHACDDEVITRGVHSAHYAKVLMHFAAARPLPVPALRTGMGFLRFSPTKARILSILDGGLDRAPVGVRAGLGTAVVAGVLLIPVGSLSLMDYTPGTGPTEALVAALKDEAPEVRARAARTLGRREATCARVALEGLLDDPSSDVRLAAVAALQQAGDPASIPAMAHVLTRPFDGGRGEHGFVLKLAMKTLGKTDHPDAVPVLEAQLDRPVAQLRWLALEELANMPTQWPAALPHLRRFAKGDPDRRNRANARETLDRLQRSEG